jgi:hypothetical protein
MLGNMIKSTSIRPSTVAHILRARADRLRDLLTELLGPDDDLDVEELTPEQKKEFWLFVVSLVRVVAAEVKQMIPYLGEVATFGATFLYTETSVYSRHTDMALQELSDVRLREYLSLLDTSPGPEPVSIDAALRRFADMANADADLRRRITGIGTRKFLLNQLADFFKSLASIEVCATELEKQARDWLAQRARAPDGHERHYGSFGDPSTGLRMSPRMQRWNPGSLDDPLRSVVLELQDEFDAQQDCSPAALRAGSSDTEASASLKERFSLLAMLLADGTISQAEHDTARKRILDQL